jgi:hypothetical protein
MRVNTYFGRSLHFKNGLSVGFNWVHGNGESSKTSAIIAGYHPPRSITWLWALYWNKPAGLKPSGGKLYHGCYVRLPLVGALELRCQEPMWRKPKEGKAG